MGHLGTFERTIGYFFVHSEFSILNSINDEIQYLFWTFITREIVDMVNKVN
jgi:hypothetical protein